jgi:NADPH:quinone reductase-like Zn-dependent oxidoreductase
VQQRAKSIGETGGKMEVMQMIESAQGPTLAAAEVAQPKPGRGQILIRVYAAGVTTTELHWDPTTHKKSGEPRLNAIPGHEFSGVIAAIGSGADGFNIGQEVYGMNDWYAEGATAEYCLTEPSSIARKPASLTHEAAATVPIGALTAWQGLLDRVKLQRGERVLVHGGSGGVGVFAVQLAHIPGAHVIATTSSHTVALVRELGADEIIDYKTARFEQVIDPVDVVFDTVGGETRERSWSVLKPGGRMVSIVGDGGADPRAKDAFFIVEPNHLQLVEVAKMLDAGSLKTFVNAAVPLNDAATAYAGKVQQKRGYGKVVVVIGSNR